MIDFWGDGLSSGLEKEKVCSESTPVANSAPIRGEVAEWSKARAWKARLL